ncbi:MAG: hypothetical protein MUF73_06215 [Rhodobacteraceae bacterium]|jgi:hypothetical protein|nr:hypothetical protein [Paracoccaceae bacterium]
MRSPLRLTPLETAALAHAHARDRDVGMPPPDQIAVDARRNTGAGRYARLVTAGRLTCADGTIALFQCDMAGWPAGGMVSLEVEMGVPPMLEVIVNGVFPWDGTEAADVTIIEV